MTTHLFLDIATAPIADAAQYLEPVSAPANYKDPEKIAAYVKEKEAEQASRCGLDLDLCRISGIGWEGDGETGDYLCRDEKLERLALASAATAIRKHTVLVGYNSLKFDWPVLMRRARYLGVDFPSISLDRYRTPHLDLFDRLTNHGALPGHSLRFYAARLGWLDLQKPLMGDEEARVFETGKWDELAQSIRHDVTATQRLAEWMGVL